MAGGWRQRAGATRLGPGLLGTQTGFRKRYFVPIQANHDPEAAERESVRVKLTHMNFGSGYEVSR